MTASQIDGLLALYDAGILHQSCVQFFREGWKTFFRSPHETVSHAPLSRSKVLPVVSILGSAGVGKTWLLCRLKEHALALPFASPLIGFSSCDIGGHAVVFMDTNPSPIPSVTSSTTVSLSEQQALMRDSIRDVEDHVRDAHRLTELVHDLGSLSQVDAQILVVGDDMDAAAQQHLARMHLAAAERGKPLIVVHVWKRVRSWDLSLESVNACLAEVSQILQLKGTVAKVKGAFEMHIGCSKHIILPQEPERLTNLQQTLFKAGFDRIKELLTMAISQNKATSDKAALSPPDLLKDIATKLSKLLPGKYIATTLRRSREFVVLHDAQNHLLRPFYVDEEGEHVPVPLSITQMLRSFAPSPSNVLYNTSRSRGKSKNGQPVWINVVSIVLPSLDGCRALARIRDQLQWGTQSLEVEYNPGAESPKHDSEVRAVETKDGPKSAILEDDPQRKKAQEADDPKGNTSVAVDPRTLKSITFWAVLREVPESLVASLGAEDPLLEASINSRFATYDVHICVHTHIERCLKDVPPCILYGSGLLTVTVLSELSTQEQQNAPLASVLAQPEPTEARDCHPPEPQRGDDDASSRSSPDPTLNGPQYDGCDE